MCNLTSGNTSIGRPIRVGRLQPFSWDQRFSSLWNDFFGIDLFDTDSNYQTRTRNYYVEDEGDNLVLRIAAPGLRKNDFSVTVSENSLTVTYESQKNGDNSDKNEVGKFGYQSRFERTWKIPRGVEDIKASYEAGILTVTVKKPEVVNPPTKRIEVQ